MNEIDTRALLVRLAASLFARGFSVGSAGNISTRLDDGGYLITPTNSSLGALDAARISKLNGDFQHVGGDKPSKEVFMHRAFYTARADAGAVVHLHSTQATAVSCLPDVDPSNPIPPLTPYFVMRVGRRMPIVEYYRPGDPAMEPAIHAAARDAVHARLDTARQATALAPYRTIEVSSQAGDRTTYLRRPDLGRRLAPAHAAGLARGDWDLAIVAADGLSAKATQAHAPPLIAALADRLRGWRIAPIAIATQARVALGDEIGAALGAGLVLVLIGERPGLSAPDSLGAYLTWRPSVGTADSARNCVSNIRPPHGLDYAAAADTLAWLIAEARARALTGVALKDDRPAGVSARALPATPWGEQAQISTRG